MRDFVIPILVFVIWVVAYGLGWASGYSEREVDLYKEIHGTVTNCQKVNDFDIYVCKTVQ